MAEHGHALPTSHFVKIWAILLGLLVVSVVGPMLEIPWLTLITAFGIALVKATLVMKYFMHLDSEIPIVWYILSGAVLMMALFFFGTAPDVLNHEGTAYGENGMHRWENVAAKAAVERGLAEGDGHGEHGDATHEGDEHAPAPAGH